MIICFILNVMIPYPFSDAKQACKTHWHNQHKLDLSCLSPFVYVYFTVHWLFLLLALLVLFGVCFYKSFGVYVCCYSLCIIIVRLFVFVLVHIKNEIETDNSNMCHVWIGHVDFGIKGKYQFCSPNPKPYNISRSCLNGFRPLHIKVQCSFKMDLILVL